MFSGSPFVGPNLDLIGRFPTQPAVQVAAQRTETLQGLSSKAKPSIMRRPTPVRSAQNWLEESRNLVEKAAAFLARQRGAEGIAECVQHPRIPLGSGVGQVAAEAA
jgi:hypothetical protein